MELIDQIFDICEAGLRAIGAMVRRDGDELHVNGFTVSLDDADVEEDEMGSGDLLPKYNVKKIDGHFSVLECCLDALAKSAVADKFSDLSTDGDNKDCEAIFMLAGLGYKSLKVR